MTCSANGPNFCSPATWLCVAALAILLVACGRNGIGESGTETAASADTSQGPCQEDGDCTAGFECESGACVLEGTFDASSAADAPGDEPVAPPVEVCIEPGVCLGFATLSPGTFVMGSPAGELGRGQNEDQRTITLTRRTLMQTTELTQRQWKALADGFNPSYFIDCGDDCPVDSVDWFSAVAFANALSAREGLEECYALSDCTDPIEGWHDGEHEGCGRLTFVGLDCTGYRLPTEPEWEYAARAGTTTATYVGELTSTGCEDQPLRSIAHYCGVGVSGSDKVAMRSPNAWGLYDMLGNAFEWTAGVPGPDEASAVDPVNLPLGGNSRVNVRGGSWAVTASNSRAAARWGAQLRDAQGSVGFRLVRSLP